MNWRHAHGDQGGARERHGTKGPMEGWRINGEKMWTTGMHTATHSEDIQMRKVAAFLFGYLGPNRF